MGLLDDKWNCPKCGAPGQKGNKCKKCGALTWKCKYCSVSGLSENISICPYCERNRVFAEKKRKVVQTPRIAKSRSIKSSLEKALGVQQNHSPVAESKDKENNQEPPSPNQEKGVSEKGKNTRSAPLTSALRTSFGSTTGSGKYIKAIIFFVIMAVLLFANPYIDPVKTGGLEIIGAFYPQVADYWDTIFIIISIIFIIAGTVSVMHYDSIAVMIILIVLVIVGLIAFPFIYSYMDSDVTSSYGATLMCILTNLANPEGLQQCSAAVTTPGEPDSVKVGDYDVLKVSFDTEYIGNTIFKDSNDQIKFNTFFMNMIIENPSETRAVKNFCIMENEDRDDETTALIRGGTVKTSEKIKLADLSTQDGTAMCSGYDSEGLTIGPGETLRVVLVATAVDWCSKETDKIPCEKIDVCDWEDDKCITEDKKTRTIDAQVTYRYDYAGEGQFDFVVGKTDSIVEQLANARSNPTKSDGPLDVIVYFSPTAYVIRNSSDNFVNVIVKVSKTEGESAIMYTPITISRLVEGVLTPPEKCEALWGEVDVTSSKGTESVITTTPLGARSTITKEHTYICKYSIDKEDVDDDYGEVIPFIARADYTIVDILTKKGIEVYEDSDDIY